MAASPAYAVVNNETLVHLRDRLKCEEDVSTFRNVLMLLGGQSNELRYHIDTVTDAHFIIRLSGLEELTKRHLDRLFSGSNPIDDAVVDFSERRLYVHCRRVSSRPSTKSFKRIANSERMKLQIEPDWTKSPVSDADKTNILKIVDEVYNMLPRMPNVLFFYQNLSDDSGGGEDTTESDGSAAVLGYSLMFRQMPPISYHFLQFLAESYAGLIGKMSLLIGDSHGGGALVINIRKSDQSIDGSFPHLDKISVPSELRRVNTRRTTRSAEKRQR